MKRLGLNLHYPSGAGTLTDSQPSFKEQKAPWRGAEAEPSFETGTGRSPRTNGEAIAAGLAYLFGQRRNGRWGHLNLPWGIADAGVTACVLARLGELPALFMGPSLQLAIADSLDWLEQARTPEGGWGYPGGEDPETTAWAILALRKHGRAVPEPAVELLRGCRRADGGFAYCPEARNSTPETTALAVQALRTSESSRVLDAAGFLSSWLGSDIVRPARPLFVCSGILEWERGLAPLALLNQACQVVIGLRPESALEQALLLRCLIRLRLNRAWTLAARLRAAQLDDGSWPSAARPGCDDKRIIPTATAVSALVLGDFQPGLYFGSDLPRARRLHES